VTSASLINNGKSQIHWLDKEKLPFKLEILMSSGLVILKVSATCEKLKNLTLS